MDTGSAGDTQIFSHCPLKAYIENDLLQWPGEELMMNDTVPMPCFIVGDDAFALTTWLTESKGMATSCLGLVEEAFIFMVTVIFKGATLAPMRPS